MCSDESLASTLLVVVRAGPPLPVAPSTCGRLPSDSVLRRGYLTTVSIPMPYPDVRT